MQRGQNKESTRDYNRSLILTLIKKNAPILRSDLARMTGLTKAAVTKIVAPFIRAGILVEQIWEAGDKRKRSLAWGQGQYYFVAIALGLTSRTAAIFDIGSQIIERYDDNAGIAPDENIGLSEDLAEIVEKLLSVSGVSRARVLQIGISVPGIVPAGTEIGIPFNWPETRLVETLETRFDIPVKIGNNSSLAALAELWFGAGVNRQDFVLYSIGMGIGGGAVIGGEWLSGRDRIACEIGHTIVNRTGDYCYCGMRGCLETEAGLVNVANRYQRSKEAGIVAGVKNLLADGASGDPAAKALLDQVGEYLGIGAVTLVNLFNPGLLIVAGDFVEDIELDAFVDTIREYVGRNAYSTIARRTRVVQSELGNDIPLLGAFALMLQDFVDDYRSLPAAI